MISLVKEQNVTTPIRILGKIKDPSASDFLISVALNTKFKSTASKSELLKLPELEGKLDQFFENTNDPLVFKSSVSALSEKLKKFNLVGTKTEQTILSMFKESSKLQKAAVYALAESKDPKHAHVFMILLKDSDPEIRATAVRFLDGIKSGK
jgi:HEAT repeat protein